MWLISSLHHMKCWQWWNYHIQRSVRVLKIYLYKRQTKKRNLLIGLFLLRFFEVFVLVFFRVLFFREAARDRRRVIDVIFYENHYIRVLHVDDLEYHCIEILFLLWKLFFYNSFHFYVLRRLLADIYHLFILFFSLFHSSAAMLLHWTVESFQQFVLLSSLSVFEDVDSFKKVVSSTTESDDWCREYIFYEW